MFKTADVKDLIHVAYRIFINCVHTKSLHMYVYKLQMFKPKKFFHKVFKRNFINKDLNF